MVHRITYAEAAEILGCGVSNIPKLIRKGKLASHSGRGLGPSLRRDEVEQLAEARALAAEERRTTVPAPKPSDPPESVDGHGWLIPAEAGAIVGITGQAVRLRGRKGTIPHVRRGQYWWIREDHARIAANVRATDGPEAVAIALDGI